MDVLISSRGLQLTPELEEVTREKIGRLDRYLDGLDRARVHFSEERNPRIPDRDACEITLEGHGNHVRCRVAGPDGFVAIDRAVAKLERQLRKRKTQLVNRYQHTGGRKDKHSEVHLTMPDADEIRFVHHKQFATAPMTPVEAVQQMEIAGFDFFLFANSENDGAPSVVYRRREGDYGLLEQESG